MVRSIRRALLAIAVLAALGGSTGVPAQAATQCGLLVCAEAVAFATWDCTTRDNAIQGHDYIECRGVARPDGFGSSQVAPGSVSWSGSTRFEYSFDGGMSYGSLPGPETASTTCTWPGLGENRCGGAGTALQTAIGGFVPWGACIDTIYALDLRVIATATATATKSAPVLGALDTATAVETNSAGLKDLPVAERCAFQ